MRPFNVSEDFALGNSLPEAGKLIKKNIMGRVLDLMHVIRW